jgi:c-di-GMP-binding flagellar brake protein YcgR
MEKGTSPLERRKYPRMSLDLPLEYRVMNAPYAHGGLVVNASEVGLLINSIKNIPIGSKLNIAVLFPKGFELTNFEVFAEIIWKDLYWEEDWEGYRYGLRFIKILEEDRRKLKQLLSSQFQSGEISPYP